MTSLRTEFVRTLVVLAAPLTAVAIFPYASVGFKARTAGASERPRIAFVHLTDDERETAMRAAKSAWQIDANVMRGEQAWLPLGELPEETPEPILPFVPMGRRADDWPFLDYPPPPWQPSAAAGAPTRIALTPEKPLLPFSRAEMLRLP